MKNAINNTARNQGFRKDEQGRIVWTGSYAGLVRTYVVVNADGSAATERGFRGKLYIDYLYTTKP